MIHHHRIKYLVGEDNQGDSTEDDDTESNDHP
jgi:hypothetical protein